MKSLRLSSLVLATLLQFAPIARLVQSSLPFQSSPLAIILRWVAGAVAVAGAFHTVSGATATKIKTSGSTTGTNGLAMTVRIVITENSSTYTPEAWSFNGRYAVTRNTSSITNGVPTGMKFSLSTGIINGKPQEAGTFPIATIAYRFDTNEIPLGGFKLIMGKLEPQASIPIDFTITVNPNPDFPAIVTHPGDVTVNVGEPISLSVSATGKETLIYQWIHDGSNVPTGTGPNLSIASATVLDAGSYSVRVTNTLGKVISNSATVVVNAATGPNITVHPQDSTVHVGEAALMKVTAESASPMTFQWRHGEDDVPGGTTPELPIAAATANDAGDYVVIVTSGGTSVTSNPGKLTVIPLALETPLLGVADVTLRFGSIPGRSYLVEANPSLDPANWGLVKEQTADAATLSVVDATIDQPLRIWRVRLAP